MCWFQIWCLFVVQIAYLTPITKPMNNEENVWELGLRVGENCGKRGFMKHKSKRKALNTPQISSINPRFALQPSWPALNILFVSQINVTFRISTSNNARISNIYTWNTTFYTKKFSFWLGSKMMTIAPTNILTPPVPTTLRELLCGCWNIWYIASVENFLLYICRNLVFIIILLL